MSSIDNTCRINNIELVYKVTTSRHNMYDLLVSYLACLYVNSAFVLLSLNVNYLDFEHKIAIEHTIPMFMFLFVICSC